MRNILGIGLLGTLLLSGCVWVDGSFHKKELTSFRANRVDNPNLPQAIDGYIDQTKKTITFTIPPNLPMPIVVVRFEYSGIGIAIDGSPAQSGSTTIDLARDHWLTVRGRDEEITTFTIHVEFQPKYVRSFYFYTGQNPTLETTLSGSIQPYGYSSWSFTGSTWVQSATTEVFVTLPITAAETLIPSFEHNSANLLWKGVPLVSGVTPIDVTNDQVLTLVGVDGSTQNLTLKLTHAAPALSSFSLLRTDNPTLRKDYAANIDASTKVISLAVPTYVDPKAMVPQITIVGTKILIDGTPWTKGTAVDLSQGHTITLPGSAGTTTDYKLLITSVAPSSAKTITTKSFYGSVYQKPPFVPTSSDSFSVYESSSQTDAYRLRTYNSKIDRSLVYLEIVTDGISVLANGTILTQGLLTKGLYSPSNWINFSVPVVLTVTAEDLSTQTLTYILETN